RMSDSTTLVQALGTGEVVAAMTWSDVPTALVAEDIPVKFADVKEGGLTWVCGLVMAKDAPHPDKAYELLDVLLSPDSGYFCIAFNAYGHCNAKSFDLFTEEELNALSLSKDPTSVLSRGVFLQAQPEEVEQKINRDWGELISEL
ncbi:MAG: extracellular solute-binding protein, partial [Pseudomonadota bacterium]